MGKEKRGEDKIRTIRKEKKKKREKKKKEKRLGNSCV